MTKNTYYYPYYVDACLSLLHWCYWSDLWCFSSQRTRHTHTCVCVCVCVTEERHNVSEKCIREF